MGQLIRPLLLVSLPDFFSSREKKSHRRCHRPVDAPWLDREEAPLTLLLGGLRFMEGKKKRCRRRSAAGRDQSGISEVSWRRV